MELKELEEKLNKKHVKVKIPKIYSESYAARYAGLLKDFTNNIVENFSGLVLAIFEEVVKETNNINNNIVTFDEAGDFDFWDNFFKENEDYIADIERKQFGRKKRKSPDESKRAWKEALGIITAEITAKNPKIKKSLLIIHQLLLLFLITGLVKLIYFLKHGLMKNLITYIDMYMAAIKKSSLTFLYLVSIMRK